MKSEIRPTKMKRSWSIPCLASSERPGRWLGDPQDDGVQELPGLRGLAHAQAGGRAVGEGGKRTEAPKKYDSERAKVFL